MQAQFLQTVTLLAQSRFRATSQSLRMQQDGIQAAYMMLGITIMVVAIIVVAVYFIYYHDREATCEPRKLFRELCRANHLSWRQRRLLRDMAKIKRIADPLRLFLNADLWMIDTAKDTRLCKPRVRSRLQAMHKMLFTTEK